jgi:hypothetical protein
VKLCYSARKSARLNPSFPPLFFERKFGASQGLVLDLKIFILGAAPIAAINQSPDGGKHKHFE